MSDEKIKEVMNKLVDLFVSKEDALITKGGGEKVLIAGGSLSIFGDPIFGRTKGGENVRIRRSDIADAVPADAFLSQKNSLQAREGGSIISENMSKALALICQAKVLLEKDQEHDDWNRKFLARAGVNL